jgi:asparagine synthase (glutamine-hydrolysing)
MIDKLSHRRPDGVNHYSGGNLSLEFTRLSILDLEGGMQPIFNENNSVIIICNGEIFNYIELREKFAFHAPGSPYLLRNTIGYVNDLLSYENIKRQDYFNPDTVEKLKNQYMAEGFSLRIPYEINLLIIVMTFGIFLEVFQMLSR